MRVSVLQPVSRRRPRWWFFRRRRAVAIDLRGVPAVRWLPRAPFG